MKKIMSLALILCFSIVSFGQTSAESTAKTFYNAWRVNNKAKIVELSTPKVAKQKNYPPAKNERYDFEGCSADGKNWRCVWYMQGGEGGWGISMLVKKVSGKFKVAEFLVGMFEAMD